MSNLTLNWIPPGPVAEAFYWDRSPVDAIMGPVGSGKTSAALMRMVRQSGEQAPSPLDNQRLARNR